jgi:hypothetical protein
MLSVGSLARAAAETAIDFNRDIRPILADACYHCHGPDAAQRKAKLRLDEREGLFRTATASRSWHRVNPRRANLFSGSAQPTPTRSCHRRTARAN